MFINAELGRESEALEKLRQVEGVIEGYLLYGVHDMVAVVEVDTVDRVKEVVSKNIRRIEGVHSTLSMIVMEEKG